MANAAFSDVYLRSLKLPQKGQYAVWDKTLPTFGVRVSQGGSKTFVLNRNNNFITIGRFGVLTLANARTEAKRLLAEFTLGKVRPKSITFPAAVELFLAEKRKSCRPATVANHADRLKRHLPFKGQLADITHQDIVRRLAKISTNAEHDHALSVAKTFFTWSHNRRYIDDDPTRGLSPHGSQSRARVLTEAELRSIWEASKACGQFGVIVRLLILTGMRRGECAAIQASCIRDDVLVLPSSLTKNHREHHLPLSTSALALLPLNGEKTGLLFPARGKSSPFNGWSKAKAQLDKLSGVEDWTLHDLRRTFATRLAELGVAPHIIERLLNHVSGTISGVAAVYNRHHFMPEMRAAIEKWEVFFFAHIINS